MVDLNFNKKQKELITIFTLPILFLCAGFGISLDSFGTFLITLSISSIILGLALFNYSTSK